MTEIELSWAAGFFDGEGCVCYSRHNNRSCYGRIDVSISQVDRRVLDRFIQATALGHITGPYATQLGRSQWRYGLTRYTSIKQLYDLLCPYLSEVKLEQFRQCFSAYDSEGERPKPHGKGQTRAEREHLHAIRSIFS